MCAIMCLLALEGCDMCGACACLIGRFLAAELALPRLVYSISGNAAALLCFALHPLCVSCQLALSTPLVRLSMCRANSPWGCMGAGVCEGAYIYGICCALCLHASFSTTATHT